MAMSSPVTARAECNQILRGVASHPAPRAHVMNLEVLRSAAVLAAPPVACERFAGELAIRRGFKP